MSLYDQIWQYIIRFLEITITNLWGGFFWLIVGIVALILTYKDRNAEELKYTRALHYHGYLGAVMLIMLGIMVIYWNLTGKL